MGCEGFVAAKDECTERERSWRVCTSSIHGMHDPLDYLDAFLRFICAQ